MLRPSSLSFDRYTINSAPLVLYLVYLAGVLAGQTHSFLLMPLVAESSPIERRETKVV